MSLTDKTDNLELLPSRSDIKKNYDIYFDYLNQIKENIEKVLKTKIQISSVPTYKSRVKSFDSYYRKIERIKPNVGTKTKNLICLSDLIGIRIICAFLEDLSLVEDQIRKKFNVKEVEIKGSQNNFREFGYESVHILITIPKNCIPKKKDSDTRNFNLPFPSDLHCEIQIRTILQDAWAEVEHELVYKNEFSPFDMPLRRKLASINASLSLADMIFQEIRDYQKKLQGEVKLRRESFYKQVDRLTLTEKATQKKGENIGRVSPYIHGTIDDLLLEGLQAHNEGEFKKAIEIYTTIINSRPKPEPKALSVIYKHLGMAYFATNDYDAALESFLKSTEYDPGNFRALYYSGIVYTIKSDYHSAVKFFTNSLIVNRFQAHAHFHRAVAYFHLNQYDDAFRDLAAAEKLGLNDIECASLKQKLVEKFGMNM